jgi:hypothetical protein
MNERGSSALSPASVINAKVQTIPHTMAAPSQGTATSYSQIEVDWQTQTDPADGGSAITSFHLQMSNDGTNFVDIVGGSGADYTGTSYIVNTGITQGSTYVFRIKSANKWGWALNFSPSVSILAASVPDKVS